MAHGEGDALFWLVLPLIDATLNFSEAPACVRSLLPPHYFRGDGQGQEHRQPDSLTCKGELAFA